MASKAMFFQACPGLRQPQKMLISTPGAGDPKNPKSAESPQTRWPHICRLDAQMGAKAPILLDVRTSISDLDGKS